MELLDFNLEGCWLGTKKCEKTLLTDPNTAGYSKDSKMIMKRLDIKSRDTLVINELCIYYYKNRILYRYLEVS